MTINKTQIKAILGYQVPNTFPKTLRDFQVERYKNLLDLSIWNPTIGAMVKRDYFGDVSDLQQDKTVRYLEGLLVEQINKLYPKTKKLREYIVQDRRISLNRIKPCKVYTLLEKLKIFLK